MMIDGLLASEFALVLALVFALMLTKCCVKFLCDGQDAAGELLCTRTGLVLFCIYYHFIFSLSLLMRK